MECYGEEMAFRQKRPFFLRTATFPNSVIKFLFCDAISCPFCILTLFLQKGLVFVGIFTTFENCF